MRRRLFKPRYSRRMATARCPYLNYIQRLAVDRLFNSMEYNRQYEEVWQYVATQSTWNCIKYLVLR